MATERLRYVIVGTPVIDSTLYPYFNTEADVRVYEKHKVLELPDDKMSVRLEKPIKYMSYGKSLLEPIKSKLFALGALMSSPPNPSTHIASTFSSPDYEQSYGFIKNWTPSQSPTSQPIHVSEELLKLGNETLVSSARTSPDSTNNDASRPASPLVAFNDLYISEEDIAYTNPTTMPSWVCLKEHSNHFSDSTHDPRG